MHLQVVGDQIRMYDLTGLVNAFYASQAGNASFHMSLADVLPGYQTDASYAYAYGDDLAVNVVAREGRMFRAPSPKVVGELVESCWRMRVFGRRLAVELAR